MDTDQRKALLGAEFKRRFGAEPDIWSRAPGRVDLMGSHTDYNQGAVMTMTVDRDTWIAARRRPDGMVRVRSLNIEGESCFALNGVAQDEQVPWSNYVRGMAVVMQNAGFPLQGFDGLVHSTIPFGSGLSSSAAFEMATAVTFGQVSGFNLDPLEMARLGQRAENDFVGVNTGILDQYSSAMGRSGCAICLDCRSLTSDSVPIFPGLAVIICDTRATRKLVGSEYDDRRAQCEAGVRQMQKRHPEIRSLRDASLDQLAAASDLPAVVARRCRFIIQEHRRVHDLAKVLPTGDHRGLFGLFRQSYEGARDLFGIGVPAMEAMIQAMETAPGVVAARQAGAGFGGCMVALVEVGLTQPFSAHVQRHYGKSSGNEARIFAVQAAAGAGPLAM